MVHVGEDRVPQATVGLQGVDGAQALGGQRQAAAVLAQLGQEGLVVSGRHGVELVHEHRDVPAPLRSEDRLLADGQGHLVDERAADQGGDVGAHGLLGGIHEWSAPLTMRAVLACSPSAAWH